MPRFNIWKARVVATLVGPHQLILLFARFALSTKIESINVLDLPTWRAVPTTHECGGIRGVSRRPKPAASGSTLGAFAGSEERVREVVECWGFRNVKIYIL